jgi:Tol biopolymer transport system component
MRRAIALTTVAWMALLGSIASPGPAQAKAPGRNGQIAFQRQDPTVRPSSGCILGCSSAYTINPDGTHEQKLSPTGLGSIYSPNWSPDGTQIAVFADCDFGGGCGAIILNADSGSVRVLPNPDPAVFNEFFSCHHWSPTGTRLACDAVGDTPGVTGIYTMRASDGGGLTQITTAPPGVEDGPADYSPDGKRLVFVRGGDTVNAQLFVVDISGGAPKQITPPRLTGIGEASWSPSGNKIVFGAQLRPDHRSVIMEVNPDGSGLHKVPIPGCGGASSDPTSIGCSNARWSPDGTKIAFIRTTTRFGIVQNVYTVNADGSGLAQVTHNGAGLAIGDVDWGPHPLAT